jgi:HD-GYP domain-containing protein (c-di-GMP phosphodiesterase class II)
MLGISSRSSCKKWFKQVEIFTAYDARKILKQIKNNPTLSGTILAAKIKKSQHKKVNPETIRRVLRKSDVYGLLKLCFELEICTFQKTNNAGRIVNQYDIAKLFASVYLRVAVTQNAISGFQSSGVSLFNSNIFSDTDYVPASVTDHPYRDCTPASPTHSHNLNSLIYVQIVSLSRTSTGLTTDSMTHCDQPKSGPSTTYSPHDIVPCQTALKTVNIGQKRECKRAEILTSTPV